MWNRIETRDERPSSGYFDLWKSISFFEYEVLPCYDKKKRGQVFTSGRLLHWSELLISCCGSHTVGTGGHDTDTNNKNLFIAGISEKNYSSCQAFQLRIIPIQKVAYFSHFLRAVCLASSLQSTVPALAHLLNASEAGKEAIREWSVGCFTLAGFASSWFVDANGGEEFDLLSHTDRRHAFTACSLSQPSYWHRETFGDDSFSFTTSSCKL